MLNVMRFARPAALASAFALLSCHRAPAPSLAHAPTPARPLAGAPAPAPSLAPAQIDAMLRAAWQSAGITPSPPVDDARFLRRAYVDIVGTIPPPDEVAAFVADTSPDKRAKLVDTLLASPRYADHWAEYWDDVLMGRQVREPTVDRAAFRAWLRDAMAKNTPWNTFVVDLVSATGQNSEGGNRRGGYAQDSANDDAGDPDSPVNGAVNWLLKFGNTPQDLAGTASRVFLGVQIQCAQCHDHKTEKWKKQDFERFASAFTRMQLRPIDRGPAMGKIRRVELRERDRPVPRFAKNPDAKSIVEAPPTALDGTDLSKDKNARRALAVWMASGENPWFARAIVNRIWGHFLGRGFVDPVDDLRASNPASAPELFDALASDFAAHGYDVKRLMKTIAMTEAYQLAPAPASSPEKNDTEHKLWARFRVAPLDASELIHALIDATSLQSVLEKRNVNVDNVRFQIGRAFGFLFDIDEETDKDDFDGTIAQALALLNGSVVGAGSRAVGGGALSEILAKPGGDGEKVDAIFLRTLSRYPSADERAYFVKYVADAQAAGAAPQAKKVDAKGDPLRRFEAKGAGDPRVQAFEDVFWALLNSSEFVFNH